MLKYLSGICICLLLLAGCKKPAKKSQDGQKQTSAKEQKAAPPLKGGYVLRCEGKKLDLAGPVMAVAKGLERQKFAYRQADTADCSGMFHRMLIGLQTYCPDHDYPAYGKYRDSRELARWYHKHKELELVLDPLEMEEMIKPGAVMFYGYGDRKYKKLKYRKLFVRGKGINHVGVVTSVQKDSKGNIISYALFHGRNPKYPAGITDFHRREPSRDHYPVFGNGDQPWLAVAPVLF